MFGNEQWLLKNVNLEQMFKIQRFILKSLHIWLKKKWLSLCASSVCKRTLWVWTEPYSLQQPWKETTSWHTSSEFSFLHLSHIFSYIYTHFMWLCVCVCVTENSTWQPTVILLIFIYIYLSVSVFLQFAGEWSWRIWSKGHSWCYKSQRSGLCGGHLTKERTACSEEDYKTM